MFNLFYFYFFADKDIKFNGMFNLFYFIADKDLFSKRDIASSPQFFVILVF